jgi:hypothetical protein
MASKLLSEGFNLQLLLSRQPAWIAVVLQSGKERRQYPIHLDLLEVEIANFLKPKLFIFFAETHTSAQNQCVEVRTTSEIDAVKTRKD